MAQVAARYGGNAPMAAACCNACRTRTTTNLLSLGLGAVVAAGYGAACFAQRIAKSS